MRRLFLFQDISLDQPADQIIDTESRSYNQKSQNKDRGADHDLEIPVTIRVRRRQLVLRKIRRRSIHDYSLKLIAKN